MSRTFALSIRLLPGELGAAVRDAYLLCRIADTIEDAPNLDATEKARCLDLLAACFDDPAAPAALVACTRELAGDAAHVRLVRNADLVFEAFAERAEASRRHVREWVREMIAGMRKFTLAYPNGIRIQSLEEYKEYCYYVAGTVGYLLTDLWFAHSPTIGERRYAQLRERCRDFAEALQTVNILKDVAVDAERENAIYVPHELLVEHGSTHAELLSAERATETHTALRTLVQLAWRDLDQATAYLLTIPRRAVAIRLFCALPLLFAYATLRDLTRTPDAIARRHTVKISRAEVRSLTILSFAAVGSNRALKWLVGRTRAGAVLPG